jgi:uncharacterized protein
MILDEIRHRLSTARDVPEAALAAAVEQAEALVPEVLRLVDLAARSVVLTRPEERLLFYGVHALAAARRTELYGPLLELTNERSLDFRWLLCDASLTALLVSTMPAECEPPYRLLANPYVHGESKIDLFLLIAWMVLQGRAPREEFVAFLDRFDRDAEVDIGDSAWYGWQQAIGLLRLTEFEERVRRGWEAGRVRHDNDADREEFIRELHRAVDDAADERLFEVYDLAPIGDLPKAFRRFLFFGFGDGADEDEAADPARDVCLIPDEMQWLRAFLEDEIVPPDTMRLEALDGFLTGLAAGPGVVPQDEWWPRIWSEGGEQPEYETETQEPYVRALVDRHLETIRRRLAAGRHEPPIDENSAPEAVEEWAFGFATATTVRAGSWDPIGKHKQAALAVASISLLIPPHPDDEEDEGFEPLDDDARRTIVGNLPHLIRMVHAFWHGQPVQPLIEPRRSQKIGRNEPCPCGSGRKYKKCCGAN